MSKIDIQVLAKLMRSAREDEISYFDKIDGRSIPDKSNEIRLFMVVRNEQQRLPFFYNFYRELGVQRFFVIDNGSEDDTQKFLLRQTDTHVFHTSRKFKEKEYWIQKLLNTYGQGHWCLVVDADELFIYPYYESIKLKQLCAFLDQKKSTAMETLLVDMYSKYRMAECGYKMGESFFSCFGYYDAYCYRRIWDERINKVSGEKVRIQSYFGGTRELKLGCEKICCSKYPLLKYQRGMYIDAGMHGLTRAVVSEMQGVTLHFKFFPDFAKRVCVEAEREEHFGKAKEYKAYERALENGMDVLFDGRSIRYTGSGQMLQLGFMRNPYEDFRVGSIQ